MISTKIQSDLWENINILQGGDASVNLQCYLYENIRVLEKKDKHEGPPCVGNKQTVRKLTSEITNSCL